MSYKPDYHFIHCTNVIFIYTCAYSSFHLYVFLWYNCIGFICTWAEVKNHGPLTFHNPDCLLIILLLTMMYLYVCSFFYRCVFLDSVHLKLPCRFVRWKYTCWTVKEMYSSRGADGASISFHSHEDLSCIVGSLTAGNRSHKLLCAPNITPPAFFNNSSCQCALGGA